MKWTSSLFLGLLFLVSQCSERRVDDQSIETPTTKNIERATISREVYHDKVLGMLLGSAIGDAMGAPTEMWTREDIQLNYGFVSDLDSMVRSPTAEGTWKYNLPAGGTTDDTRWKKLTIEYLLSANIDQLQADDFANFITSEYKRQVAELKNTNGFDPAPFEENLMKMAWLQEWALVAKPFKEKDMVGYANAMSNFYGGEMTCAGMLYSPIFGAAFPKNASLAYKNAYDAGIFDLGYARDMTGLVSAMVSACFEENATIESVLNVNRTIDPEGFFKSRLVGRSAYRFFMMAKTIDFETSAMTEADVDVHSTMPKMWRHLNLLEYTKLKKAFDMLDLANEDVAFHPGEIYLIAITAMMFCDFDFEKSMAFIVNYGRDNDTVAAIAGAILGAYWGGRKLPADMVKKVIAVNKNELGIDLEGLATQLTEKYFD